MECERAVGSSAQNVQDLHTLIRIIVDDCTDPCRRG